MLSRRKVYYRILFCGGYDWLSFVAAVHEKETVQRVCCIGVEGTRMFLGLQEGTPFVEFFEREDRSWSKMTKVPRIKKLDVDALLESADTFEHELAIAFFFTFPRAEESYYKDLLKSSEVIAMLKANPTEDGLFDLQLYYVVDDRATEDEDGVVTVVCDDGELCMPYHDVDGVKQLDLTRALLHPDNFVVSWVDNIFEFFSEWKSRLSTITFRDVLGAIDKLIK